jgi:hypothetical protein
MGAAESNSNTSMLMNRQTACEDCFSNELFWDNSALVPDSLLSLLFPFLFYLPQDVISMLFWIIPSGVFQLRNLKTFR